MRQIDGDALKKKLYRLAYDSWKQRYMTTWETAYKEFMDMIDDMPTIERNCEGCRFTFCKELTEAMEDDLR